MTNEQVAKLKALAEEVSEATDEIAMEANQDAVRFSGKLHHMLGYIDALGPSASGTIAGMIYGEPVLRHPAQDLADVVRDLDEQYPDEEEMTDEVLEEEIEVLEEEEPPKKKKKFNGKKVKADIKAGMNCAQIIKKHGCSDGTYHYYKKQIDEELFGAKEKAEKGVEQRPLLDDMREKHGKNNVAKCVELFTADSTLDEIMNETDLPLEVVEEIGAAYDAEVAERGFGSFFEK